MKFYLKSRLQLPVFITFCFLFSWLVWVPLALQSFELVNLELQADSPLTLFMLIVPGLAAILITAFGIQGVSISKLLKPVKNWKVGVGWYFFVLLFPLFNWCIAGVIDDYSAKKSYGTTVLENVIDYDFKSLIMILVFLSITSLGEEIGWRGFVLPRLQRRFSALTSSVFLGMVWGIWHIPMFISTGMNLSSLLVQLLTIISFSIIITWVYNNTKGSLFIVWLFHWTLAATASVFPPLTTLTDDVLIWAFSIVIIFLQKPLNLSLTRNRVVLENIEAED